MSIARTASFSVVSTIALVAVPFVTYAKSFKDVVDTDILPLGNQIIALLYALAFLMFLVGMVRLFFSHNAENREKGKYFAIYSAVGLLALFAIWGIVRVLVGVLDSFNT
jgi:ABC-type amino acid transport system permease subunit